MHLVDKDKGFMGSSSIVGNSIPLGVGLGLSLKLKKSKNLSIVFLGDAAVETGAFFESVNFAVVKKLPVLFLCENNLYSVYSPLSVRQPEGRSIAKMAEGLGLKSGNGDGNDVAEVYTKTVEALASIRGGEGPQLLEFSTYRWLEHCGPNYDNDLGYRTEVEYLAWKAKEPIARFESVLLASAIVSVAEVKQMDLDIVSEVNDAFEFADASPFPSAASAYTDLHHIESSVTGIQPESVGV